MLLNSLKYTGMSLDRVPHLRGNTDWMQAQIINPEKKVLPLWKNQHLIRKIDGAIIDPEIIYLTDSEVKGLIATQSDLVLLGLQEDIPIFAVEISHLDESIVPDFFNEGEFIDLRQIGTLLNAEDAALLGYSRAIMHWHYHNQYCGRCGALTESRLGGNIRTCTNKDCSKDLFPRTDPAVIMLVEKKGTNGNPDQCLLGSSGRFVKNAYSTLAGFVEPGESLEETVAREVYEESGIHVRNVEYAASQPWPFPASVMLGFSAEAISFDIHCDDDELIDARWFTVEEILNAGEWGDDDDLFKLPRKDSIARYLIDQWIEKVQVVNK